MGCEMDLYEGKEKYIFVSYCHKDKARVIPVIEKMIQKGYRVWYDKGINPGANWPEIVAKHLNNSLVVMAFVTENYVKSQNCVNELHFAVAKRKEMLSIMMESVKLTLGIEMQLAASQAIYQYRYKNENDFYEQLFSSDVLKECLEEKTEGRVVREIPKVKKSRKEPTKKRKNSIKIVMLIFALLFGVTIGYQSWDNVTIGTGTYSRKDSRIVIQDQIVTAEMVREMKQLKELSSVVFINCEIKENALDGLENVEKLSKFEMEKCKGVDDYSFLENLDNLDTLRLNDCGVTNKSLRIEKMLENLWKIQITGNPELSDISWVSYMPHLCVVDLSGNAIEDIEPLMHLESIKSLNLNDNKIKKITSACSSLRMYKLLLANNQIADLTGLYSLTVLEEFDFSGNDYVEKKEQEELDFLEKSAETLKKVDLSENDFSDEELKKLEICGKLEELKLNYNPRLSSLDFIEKIETLKVLLVRGCNLSLIGSVGRNENLEELDLSYNYIETIENFFETSTELNVNLSGNKLTDITGIPSGRYNKLLLYDNPLDEASINRLQQLKGYLLGVTYNDYVTPKMSGGFDVCYIEGVPLDRRVSFEDSGYGYYFERREE